MGSMKLTDKTFYGREVLLVPNKNMQKTSDILHFHLWPPPATGLYNREWCQIVSQCDKQRSVGTYFPYMMHSAVSLHGLPKCCQMSLKFAQQVWVNPSWAFISLGKHFRHLLMLFPQTQSLFTKTSSVMVIAMMKVGTRSLWRFIQSEVHTLFCIINRSYLSLS